MHDEPKDPVFFCSNETEATYSSDPSRGAMYVPLHGTRKVRIIPIQEHELTTISICNTQVALWCSIGTLAIGLLLSCVWDLCTLPEGEEMSAASWVFAGACALGAVLSYGLAWLHHRKGNDEVAKIVGETESVMGRP